jgi:hypothetical protein
MASQMNSGNSKVKSNEHDQHRNLDLDQLVQDVQAVVCLTLNEKLKRVYDMHREYKETHDAVMQIPAVRKLVRPYADMGATTVTADTIASSDCEEIQQLIAENASLKAKVSELENSILKMMDAHITTELDESESESESESDSDSDSEPENITLVIQETEEELGENEEPGIIDTVIHPVVAEEEEDEEEEEEDDVTNESGEEEAEDEEAPATVHLKPTVVSEEEEEEEEEAEEEEEIDNSNEEVEVIETEINGKPYFTTDETSGVIYECTPDGDIGDEVGKFVGGKAVFV